jgi:hypothetical protein
MFGSWIWSLCAYCGSNLSNLRVYIGCYNCTWNVYHYIFFTYIVDLWAKVGPSKFVKPKSVKMKQALFSLSFLLFLFPILMGAQSDGFDPPDQNQEISAEFSDLTEQFFPVLPSGAILANYPEDGPLSDPAPAELSEEVFVKFCKHTEYQEIETDNYVSKEVRSYISAEDAIVGWANYYVLMRRAEAEALFDEQSENLYYLSMPNDNTFGIASVSTGPTDIIAEPVEVIQLE